MYRTKSCILQKGEDGDEGTFKRSKGDYERIHRRQQCSGCDSAGGAGWKRNLRLPGRHGGYRKWTCDEARYDFSVIFPDETGYRSGCDDFDGARQAGSVSASCRIPACIPRTKNLAQRQMRSAFARRTGDAGCRSFTDDVGADLWRYDDGAGADV